MNNKNIFALLAIMASFYVITADYQEVYEDTQEMSDPPNIYDVEELDTTQDIIEE